MKQLLLLWLLAFSSTITVAQTTWTGAGGTNNWSTAGNWSTGLVPTASNDVIIPGGFTVNQNVNVSIKSLDMQGDAVLNKSTTHYLRVYEPSTIGANATLNWSAGSLRGGSTLVNNGTINTADENLGITDAETILLNNGQLNMAGSGRIYLYAGTTMNNSSSGTISFISADASIRGTLLINEGSIVTDLPNQTDEVVIRSGFQNNNGTIQVDSGVFNLWAEAYTHTLTDGTYNVASGATFDWDGNLTLVGTLTGNIQGTLNSRSYIYVNESTTATLSFTGNETLNWLDGSILGGGTLENNGTIATADEYLGISGSSTILLNHGELTMDGSGYIYIYSGATINNSSTGTISFVSDGASIRGTQLINEGLIETDLPNQTDEVMIRSGFQNNNGTIEVDSGVFNLWAEGQTQTLSNGIYNVASGATFDWDGNITLLGTLTGDIQGTLNSRNYIYVNDSTTATLSFTGNETLNWLDGSILGGGTLENNGAIVTDNENLGISGASTTLLNHGELTMDGSGYIYIYSGATINNSSTGTISFVSDGASIRGTQLINEGLIETDLPNDTDEVMIRSGFQNNNGTIQVNSGVFNLWAEAQSQTLSNGTYNVASGATFDWDGNITLVGTLTGNIQGTLNSRSYIIVNETTTATLSFTGNETLNWLDGSILGGGTLENNGIIATDNENLGMSQASTILLNHGQLLMEGTGNIYIYAGASINNAASGTISFIADGASIQGTSLINEGLITTNFINGTETGNISASVQNSGVIEATSGTLNFSNALENTEEGRLSGVATIDIPSATNFTNNGIVSPGLSPGILSIIGDYSSTTSSVLEIEINGLNAGTDYDVLEITGNNVAFEGVIDIALGFDPEIGDTFTIATTTGTITSQNLTSPVTVTANGYDYTFVVSYPNDNAVVLTLDEQTLGLEEVSLSESVMMYPNPTKNDITLKQVSSINLVAIEMIDVTGKRVQYINLTNLGETHTLDLSNYAPGVYYARINTSNGSVTKKIIKQ